MKRRLNILCILVMLVLSFSVFRSTYLMGNAFIDGIQVGKEICMNKNGDAEIKKLSHIKAISLYPDNFGHMPDSVYNLKTRKHVPAIFGKMAVSVETTDSDVLTIASMIITFTDFISVLLSVIYFIILIVAINKSNIFSWKNVKRLRLLGTFLIISFVATVINVCIDAHLLSDALQVPNYHLTFIDLVSTLKLVLGIVSFIVGEVFAIGLHMKEEQELTI